MKTYRLTRGAQSDVAGIWTYIATRESTTAADRFIAKLHRGFARLARHPQMGRKREDLSADLRGFPLQKYIIFDHERRERIEIVRIIHGARDIPTVFARQREPDGPDSIGPPS